MDRPTHERPTGEGELVAQATIDNPMINSPNVAPPRHLMIATRWTVAGGIADR